VDVGWRAWRAGQRVLYVPASIVEHHHRGTIRSRVSERVVRAAIEKNRLLFQWKYLDTEASVEAHVAALHRWAIDAYLRDEREELVWLALALEQVAEARASREALPPSELDFDRLRELSS
jgi:GT2 family glycosyltransferase